MLRFALFLSILSLIRSVEQQLEDYKDPSDNNTRAGDGAGVDKWFIRESDGICTKFNFKTHALNLNVFSSRDECLRHIEFSHEDKLASCGVSNSASVADTQKNACKGLKTLRYTFKQADDNNPATCERFIYYGCGGNANNFKTVKECMDICLPGTNKNGNSADCHFSATLPKDSESMVTAVIADHHHQQCVRAGISSAQTRGKFSSLSHCRNTCFPTAGEKNKRCLYSPKQGLCLGAMIKKYYFDRETSNCMPYYTKDCVYEDMINSFESYDDCIGTCPSAEYKTDAPQGWPDASEMCKQTKNSGVGIMDIPSFYYNYETNECLPFIYTGLRGNDNRFESRELCLGVCSGETVYKVYHSNEPIPGVEVEVDGHAIDKMKNGGSGTISEEDFHILPNIIPDSN